MVISCPSCQAQYRIDPAASKSTLAKVKCPGCGHAFELLLDESNLQEDRSSAGSPVVLVVDDARFFREMIGDILKELAVELVMAADGDEAWQQISGLKPQLVLLDLNIPGKSGIEILQSLHGSPLSDQVKVLAMSGVDRDEKTALKVRHLGAVDFISKSFKPIELQNRVREILGL